MLRITKLLFILSIFSISVASAQYDVDSLEAVVANTKIHDTTRLASISLILDNLYEDDRASKYIDLMGEIARKNLSQKNLDTELKNKYTMYLAAYYNNVSIRLADSGDLKALDYLNKSLQLYRSVGADDEYFSSLVSKGILLSRRKQYREAIDSYYKALKYFERNEKAHADEISYVYCNLGVLYGEQHQYKVAIDYLKKAIRYLDFKTQKPTVEDELQKSAMYHNIGAFYLTLKNYEEAVMSLNASFRLAQKNDYHVFMSYALSKLAEIDMVRKQFGAAEEKLVRAMALSDNELAKSLVEVRMGELYYHKKEYRKANQYLMAGLARSKKIRKSDLQQEAYKLLYEVAKLTGDYKTSLQMIENYHKIEDSVKLADNRNELRRQALTYDFEKKELKLKLENERKNTWLVVLSALFVLLVTIGYFFYKNYRQKQAIAIFEKNELNQKRLLSQMNPHFIFNSIDNIQSLIYNKQDKQAVDYLTKFSKLTRQILENSNENYISLAEELTMTENYLSIQQLLHNNKFDFSIAVDREIDPETILLPPMLTQPFIENAIKHGLKNLGQKGKIDIRFKLENDKLFFEIIDNGVGFTTDEPINRKSLAMKITKERLMYMSKRRDVGIRAENILDDRKNISGAKVFFEIPYIYEN